MMTPKQPMIPIDIWKIIWAYCAGCPLRNVCRTWFSHNHELKLSYRNVSTVNMISWICCDCASREEFLKYNLTVPNLARYGYLDVLQWLYNTGTRSLINTDTMRYAAIGGHVEVVNWLRQHGCAWSAGVCTGAAKEGHFDALKWLVARGCPIDETTCPLAAEIGHLEMVKWALANGATPTSCISIYAAIGGHIDIVEWAYENRNILTPIGNSIWSGLVFVRAAERGKLSILQWGYKKGLCVHGGSLLLAASREGQIHIIEWLHNWYIDRPEKEHPAHEWARTACINAIDGGHFDVLEWYMRHDYSVGRDLCEKTSSCDIHRDNIHHIYAKFNIRCETCVRL
jgi:hypothetical protein